MKDHGKFCPLYAFEQWDVSWVCRTSPSFKWRPMEWYVLNSLKTVITDLLFTHSYVPLHPTVYAFAPEWFKQEERDRHARNKL